MGKSRIIARVQRDIPNLVSDPSAETIDALLDLWDSLEPWVRK